MTYNPTTATTTQPQDHTLALEEWQSLARQIATLTERKKAIEESLASQLHAKDGQLSTVHNINGFAITKKEGQKYTLNKKEFNRLTPEEKATIMAKGAVQNDIKMSEATVRELAKTQSALLSKCFSSKEVNEVSIKFKGE